MATKSFSLIVKNPIKDFKKNIKVDSDKSLSIRSFLLGAISQEISKVENIYTRILETLRESNAEPKQSGFCSRTVASILLF